MRKLALFAALAAAISGCATKQEPPRVLSQVAPYPEAKLGQVRHVIWLPTQKNEDLYRVELVPGKQMLTDCNTRSMAGKLSEHSLKGWGYGFFQLEGVAGPVSTMMACPPGQEQVERFVSVQVENALVRYNSKLPVVVYTPADIELRYRIWQAPQVLEQAQQ